MNRQTSRCTAFACLLAGGLCVPVAGQGIAFSGHAGTLGVGGDVSIGLGRQLAVRAGANVQPWEPSREYSGVDFTLELPSPTYTGMVDWHPGGSVFRISGGAVHFGSSTEVTAVPVAPVEIGNTTYQPSQVGTLSGRLETREIAPYVGLGFGKAPGRSGVGLALDLGVAWQGEPEVTLASNGPLASDPAFMQELAREEQNIEEDAKAIRFYPVLSLGLVIAF
ncbi:MAG: hypothetical protein L0271_06170 [Gemmatimonadetes bacterium]|nr:hypothetical protein [Gemmatimonadota bacterium]